MIELTKKAAQKFSARLTNFYGLRMGRKRVRTTTTPTPFTAAEALTHLHRTSQGTTCYLTGRDLDLNDPDSYSIDHIQPVFFGGTCELSNLGLTVPVANLAKVHMTVDEFVELCADVLDRAGYTVIGRVTDKHNRLGE